ncbi:MAG: hypothetical protein R2773_01470 [Flavobacteriaceae bacterium]
MLEVMMGPLPERSKDVSHVMVSDIDSAAVEQNYILSQENAGTNMVPFLLS